jgi:DNA-binding MarR family transcriptional regulator
MFPSSAQSRAQDQTPSALEALASRLDALERMVAQGPSHDRLPSDRKLANLAAAISRMRQRRARHFSKNLFAEPSWDILLDLFINQLRGLRVATTSLCLAANAPQATALRHIVRLEKEGLLRRFGAPEDRRLVLVEITPRGYGQMRQCLGEMALTLAPE